MHGLIDAYGTPENIDLFVGGLSEVGGLDDCWRSIRGRWSVAGLSEVGG